MERYYEAVEMAKETAVIYGIDSVEYERAITKMRIEFQLAKKTFLYKTINTIAKWQTKLQRS